MTDTGSTRWGTATLDGGRVLRWGLLHAGALVGGACFFSWSAVAVFAGLTAVTMCLGVSVGLHRGLIHRAFRAPAPVEHALALLGTLAGLGGPLGMSRMHDLRDFHQNQPEADCPPYFGYREGFARAMAYALFHTWHPRDGAAPAAPHLEEDACFRRLERAGLWLQLPLALVLYALGGASWVAWGVLVRLALTQDGFWCVHYVSHVEGDQPYELPGRAEQGRNAGWLALLSMGEAWHNTHHAYPASAQMGRGWRQPDPGWWAVRALAALRLVHDVKTLAHLPLRPDTRVRVPEPRDAPSTGALCLKRAWGRT
ncbi:acyl-CoA desaturase [Corallococcus macrosporus]|uniref:Fatty acid desaturase n=1 Tax=Corallococcus macrosporus DSM 14697 TaxID=1189310 RepID=A0A250JMR4_9BACT|nr:acyl-CoA desaturase [Corallococcus macrosporus]ATB44787.1 fatty acid desaturase [Corallococcus macrosporus DSM 14697]